MPGTVFSFFRIKFKNSKFCGRSLLIFINKNIYLNLKPLLDLGVSATLGLKRKYIYSYFYSLVLQNVQNAKIMRMVLTLLVGEAFICIRI